MVLRDIERFKVVVILFYFRSLNNLIAHTHENTLYLFQRNGVWMTVTYLILFGRQRHIQHLFF